MEVLESRSVDSHAFDAGILDIQSSEGIGYMTLRLAEDCRLTVRIHIAAAELLTLRYGMCEYTAESLEPVIADGCVTFTLDIPGNQIVSIHWIDYFRG